MEAQMATLLMGRFDYYVVPCADRTLADFNTKHNTDYKLFRTLCVSVEKIIVERFRIHCNFVTKSESKLEDGNPSFLYFLADAVFEFDRTFTLNSYSVLKGGEIKRGCKMSPGMVRHPASQLFDQGRSSQ